MRSVSITDIQRNIGDLTVALLRGEQIIVTKNGKNIAQLIPLEPAFPKGKWMPANEYADKLKKAGGTVEEAHAKIFDQGESQTPVTHICQVPNATCKNPAEAEYNVEYFAEEGIEKKKVWLCEFHRKKATESGAHVTKLIER